MAATLAKSDETEQMEAWVREYGPSVRAYLRGLARNHHQADDLAQEVFFRAWKGRERYEELGCPRAYLFRIADHLLCDSYRRKKPHTLGDDVWNLEDSARQIDPLQTVAARESHAQLYTALEQLTEVQRRILLLRYFGQLTFQEIADTVGCPLNTALSHCHRGLQLLREQFVEKS